MTPFGSILWTRRRIAAHSIASIRHESKLKVAVVGFAAIAIWFGLLYGFYWGFTYLENFLPESSNEVIGIGTILMARLLSVFALTLFFMLIFSNVMIAYSTLYKAKQVQYLLQAPLSLRAFYLAGLLECIAFSSWASAYLGSPLLIAYGVVNGAHWSFYIASFAFYLPFVAIPAAAGSIITMLMVRIFPKLPRTAFFVLAAAALGWLFIIIRQTFSADRLAEETMLTVVLQAASQTQSPLLPSYWASQGVLAAAGNSYEESIFLFLLLLSNALFVVMVGAEVAQRVFMPGFSAVLGSDRTQLRPLGKGILGRLDSLLRFIKEPIRPLVIKDIKLFWRNPTQWAQFVVFFGIMAIYVANLGNSSTAYQSDAARSAIAALNTGACTLILASLTSRFIYPLISLEGFRFWIIGLAPISLKQLIWQKFWLSIITTSPFTVGLVLLSNTFLSVDTVQFSMSLYGICLSNLALAGLAVGLGSLYPNFEEDNPARIVSGMGGTLNFLMSVGYITLIIAAQLVVLQGHALGAFTGRGEFTFALIAALVFMTVLTLISVFFPMKLGLRNLERTEL